MTRHSIHDVQHPTAENPDDGIVASAIDLTSSWQAFATPDLWIGVVFGIACIVGAIYLRRWRELAD